MIKSSLYFMFDNESSEYYRMLNVSIEGGLFSEPFVHNRSILEQQVRNNPKPYFQGIKTEPLQFNLTFYWDVDEITEEDKQAVKRWLIKPYYAPLVFSEQKHRVYYAMFVDTSELFHNGINGYVTVTVRCNSAYAYSHVMESELYDLRSNVHDGTEIEFANDGDTYCNPIIYIKKHGNGNVSIENLSDGGNKIEITDLIDGEMLEIDCESEDIYTSLDNTYRIDNVVDYQFLQIGVGINRLLIKGNCEIKFIYQYKFL